LKPYLFFQATDPINGTVWQSGAYHKNT
jgi:hypothetical protein